MAAHYNTTTNSAVVSALDIEFVQNFRGEYDRLSEILSLFDVNRAAAGTALYQHAISGSLLDTTTAEGSSGTAYVEGDFIARSKYTTTKTLVGEVSFVPYAKQTTAQAIQKAGFDIAVLNTDRKAKQQMQNAVLSQFFTFLANGTSTASGDGLQAALAYASAKLGDVLESAGEGGGEAVYFINRQDAAAYLAKAPITTQDVFGMTYIRDFLGIQNAVLTNKVSSGTVYATPIENIHVYGLDFAALADASLDYETDSLGLIGVKHVPDYDYGSVETFLVRGATFVPEVTDFIVKATITEAETTTTTTTTA